MKHLLFLVITFTISFNSIAQETYHSDYYVWAESGLSLRTEPYVDAEKITSIPYGETVKFLAFSHDELTVTEFKGFDYTGQWNKVNYNNQIGYVFAGYLALIKPPTDLHKNALDYLKDSFIEVNHKVLSKYKDCEEDCNTSGIITFKEGIIYTYWQGEGGGTETIVVPKLNILLAYTLAAKYCDDYKRYKTEYTETPIPTITVRRDDVGCDFTITVLDDFAIIKWSGGC